MKKLLYSWRLTIILMMVTLVSEISLAAMSMSYEEIIGNAEAKKLNAATIFYLDPAIMTRTATTPESLKKIGCRIELHSDSEKWENLVAIFKAESPKETTELPNEIRWGIIFRGPSLKSAGIYFAPFYSGEEDNFKIVGYVNSKRVQFNAQLPKAMTSFIQGLHCSPP